MIQARPVNDGAETGGTGWDLELQKPFVRITVQGCVTGLRTTERGVPRGWGADWQDLAWGVGLRRIESGGG